MPKKSKKLATAKSAPKKIGTKIVPTPKEKRIEPYWKELNKVIDPELNLGVVDLGLIYKVNIDKKGNATVFMTLTSPACPVGPQIINQVQDRMRLFKDIKDIQIELVWDPPWHQEMIDPDIRELLFGL